MAERNRRMMDKRIHCTRDCRERSPTCKCTCERWAEWEAIKKAEYAKRKSKIESNPIGPAKSRNVNRKAMDAMRGRK